MLVRICAIFKPEPMRRDDEGTRAHDRVHLYSACKLIKPISIYWPGVARFWIVGQILRL